MVILKEQLLYETDFPLCHV